MKIKNKVILVTGAGSGIGREITLSLLERGAKVAGVDVNESALRETKALADQHSNNFSIHVLNISDKQAVESFPQEIIAKHEHIDGLINNAGIIQPFVKVVDLDYEAIERVMNVNFYGMLYLTKTFLPLLLKRPEACIVNVSSMGGFLPSAGSWPEYLWGFKGSRQTHDRRIVCRAIRD